MTPKVFLVLSAAVAVLLTLQTTQGFTPNVNHHSRFGVGVSPSNAPEMTRPVPFPVASTSLSMATEESEDSKAKRRSQQLGAGALLLFGVLYDFFITHHGVGFWDPNYVP
jgi:hypothetical protein